jgi:hypothetical protein
VLKKLINLFSPWFTGGWTSSGWTSSGWTGGGWTGDRWATDGRSDPFDFSELDFEEVDLGQVAEELSLEEKAISNGKNELPPPSATQIDGPQEEIRAAIQGRVGKVMTGYEKRIKGLNGEIQGCRIEDKISRLKSADRELGQELSGLSDRLSSKIGSAREAVESAQKEIRTYKKRFGIERGPRRPDSRAFQVGLLASVAVLEALVNGFFFRQGMEQGIVGGAFIALILAALDVALVFFAGQYSVWAYHGTKPVHKTVGSLASLLVALWALFYNLLTTHIREHLQSDLLMQEALQQALDRFLSAPFAIEQADSLVLLFLGMGFSASAYYAGTKWDDPIPRYGQMHRDLQDRKEDLRYWKQVYQEKASRLKDEKLKEVERAFEKAEDKTRYLEELVSVKKALLKNVTECTGYYRNAYKALVRRYRDVNQRHRSTAPPEHFDEEPEIEFTSVEDYSTEEEKKRLSRQKERISEMRKKIADVKSSVEERYRKELDTQKG